MASGAARLSGRTSRKIERSLVVFGPRYTTPRATQSDPHGCFPSANDTAFSTFLALSRPRPRPRTSRPCPSRGCSSPSLTSPLSHQLLHSFVARNPDLAPHCSVTVSPHQHAFYFSAILCRLLSSRCLRQGCRRCTCRSIGGPAVDGHQGRAMDA